MTTPFLAPTCAATGARSIYEMEEIQSLWSGYGTITRYGLEGCEHPSIVVKHVRLPQKTKAHHGSTEDLSHKRKVRSYQVERTWYQEWSSRCNESCRIPKCHLQKSVGEDVWIALEDLNASGFSGRRSSLSAQEIKACLTWLANFHATFMGEKPTGLWKVGTYWHLDTRPDELQALTDLKLKNAAAGIDRKLRNSPYQTFVHGDAKIANFCFSRDGKRVAAVDFQYVGGGCGMKDVAYLLDSCLSEDACARMEQEYLDFYFQILGKALVSRGNSVDFEALQSDWRSLYPVAWTDFHRFLKGWSPGYWNPNGYSERLARAVVAAL